MTQRRSHKDLTMSYSMLFFTKHQMWSTLHPLSLTTTEWTWRESFRRTSGRFHVSQPTPLNVACYDWGKNDKYWKWFRIRSAHSREFVCLFVLFHVRYHQTLSTELLMWGKFEVSKQPAPFFVRSGLRFMLRSFSYYLIRQLRSCKS